MMKKPKIASQLSPFFASLVTEQGPDDEKA
jgi:hypothetical protein